MERKMMLLSSAQNPKIKKALELKERREREKTSLFLIEGYRELSRAVASGVVIDALFICPSFFLGVNEHALIEKAKSKAVSLSLYECTPAVFSKLSYRDRPDGLIAIAQQMRYGLEIFKKSLHPFFVVAEAIEKPGNLGTILRSADAAGVDGVIVCDRCTDIYNPNVVRASVGTLFTIPVVETTTEQTLEWLCLHQITLVAATPHATLEYTQANFKQPLAIVVGTEQIGLSKPWLEAAALAVKIPMCGVADSLNVATATTLLLYEVLRQRRCE